MGVGCLVEDHLGVDWVGIFYVSLVEFHVDMVGPKVVCISALGLAIFVNLFDRKLLHFHVWFIAI